MERSVRLRREGISIPLAIVSVAIVLTVAGGQVPADWVPHASDRAIGAIPHANVLLSLGAIGVIAYGWRAIRNGDIARHRRAMLIATALFATFLVLYLYRLTVLGGPTGFDGGALLYAYVYLPVLGLHIALAIICIPLLYDALALGLTVPERELPGTRHPTVGRLAAALWIVSFALGIVVYLLLYWI